MTVKEYEAIIRVRVKQPPEYSDMTPIKYLTNHADDPELGVRVISVEVVEPEKN